ncbi:MAG: hypothetical protein ACK5WH_06995, partial [Hyphomonadaceae bacterium]
LNLCTLSRADLQSAAINHSATSPGDTQSQPMPAHTATAFQEFQTRLLDMTHFMHQARQAALEGPRYSDGRSKRNGDWL